MGWTYLLECSDGSLYVGSTTDLPRRVEEHNRGEVPGWTTRRRPVRLLWSAEFEKINEAFALERQLHGWSRAKKLALARGDFDALPLLSSRSREGREARTLAAESDPRALRDASLVPREPPQGPEACLRSEPPGP